MVSESLSRFVGRILHPGPTREGEPLAATGRAGRNLPAAVITGAVLICVLVISLFFAPVAFVGLVVLAALAAVWELGGAFARMGITVSVAPLYVGVLGMEICAWTLGAEALLVALYLTVFALVAWRLLDSNIQGRMSDIVASIFVAVYVPFTASFFFLILREYTNPWLIIGIIAMVVASDTGGWAVGILFGRHPMVPRLSPKKSWEGFIGSFVAAVAVGVLFFVNFGAHWWWGVLAGGCAAIVGTIGDLTESLIKREAGLKDMSRLLPGHGGVLDRVDSILMTVPLMYLIMSLAFLGVS